MSGSYAVLASYSKASGYVVDAQCNCKAGAGGCCKHITALLFNILNYVELALSNIPKNKICTDMPHQWNQPINSVDNGPILFSEILCVHHSYGKHKADGTAIRLDKHKKYCACISIH